MNSRFRFQFSIAAAFCVVTSVAILCALARWERGIPYWAFPPAVLFVLSCLAASARKTADLVWSLFTVAWLVALIDAVDATIDSFGILGGPPKAWEMQARFVYAYVSRTALPLFLSVPSIHLGRKNSAGSFSAGTKWLIGCAIVGFADVTLLTTLLVLLMPCFWDYIV